MRVTIIADDKTVIVNGTSVFVPVFPLLDANVHAIQFFPETGHATIEKKAGEQAIKDRHEKIRAELAAADRKAADAVRAAEAERQRQATAVPTWPSGDMTSSGTQSI